MGDPLFKHSLRQDRPPPPARCLGAQRETRRRCGSEGRPASGRLASRRVASPPPERSHPLLELLELRQVLKSAGGCETPILLFFSNNFWSFGMFV